MTLLGYQSALARLLTDARFRRGFLDGGSGERAAFDLDDHELTSLLEIRRDRVELHSHLLAHGRVDLGFTAFPMSYEVLFEAVGEFVEDFCAAHPPRPENRGALLVEADRVYAYFAPLVASGVLGPPWVLDVMKVEHTQVRLGAGVESWAAAVAAAGGTTTPDLRTAVPHVGAHVAVVSLRYPALAIMAELRAGVPPASITPDPAPTTVLMHKVPGRIGLRVLKVNGPTADLLEACDGERDVTGVLARLGSRYGPSVHHGALITLERLCDQGIVELRP